LNNHQGWHFIYWDENPNFAFAKMSKTPKYYIGKYKSIEAFDVVLDFQEDNYNLGTAITYLLRAGKKPNNPISQDIKKAIAHLQKELEHQTHKSANHLEYFEFHNASAKYKSDGMALLYQQSNKRKIDHLLFEAAKLFANCESTYEARQEALKKEQEYLSQIYDLDPHFAERCGYKR
jgi:hypothetical protein